MLKHLNTCKTYEEPKIEMRVNLDITLLFLILSKFDAWLPLYNA